MSRQYPIWNDTSNNSYKSDKSHGARESTKTNVLIGSSSNNSFNFVTHETRVYTDESGTKHFEFLLDGDVIKSAFLIRGSKEMVYGINWKHNQ